MTFSETARQPKIDLEIITRSVNRLRPMPSNVLRLLRALEDQQVSVALVADLLSFDQALTAYILRVANSPYLGFANTCSSIREAVERLGFRQIRMLALSTVAAGTLTRRLSGYRLGDGELWQHSVEAASIARWLAESLSYPAPEEAYAAGLLHDMGKLLLDQYVLADYSRVIESMWKHKQPLWQAEERLFGIDHAELGGRMGEKWNFPPGLAEAIRCHHALHLASSQPVLAAIVHTANYLSPPDHHGLSALSGRLIHPEALRLLNLDLHELARMQVTMQKSVPCAAAVQVAPPLSADLFS